MTQPSRFDRLDGLPAGLLYSAVAVILIFGMAQVVTNPVTLSMLNVFRPIGGYDCANAMVFCVGKDSGAEYSVIGGASKAGGSTNAAGSALTAVAAAAPTVTNRATVVVGPGRWDEAAVINTSYVTLHILPGAVWRPIVTASSDVDGGIIRIAVNAAAARFSIRDIEVIVDGILQNDAYPYNDVTSEQKFESAIRINAIPTPSAPPWTNIRITGSGYIIGANEAIEWWGDPILTPREPPFLLIDGPTVIGGRLPLARAHLAKVDVQNVRLIGHTNYCEDPNTTLTNAIGPTSVDSGAGSTATFRLATSHSWIPTDKLVGRMVTFGGGGACGPNGQKRTIDDSQQSTRIVTVSPAVSATLNDADCTYTIGVVPNAILSPCQDIDWTTIRAQQPTSFGYGTTGCMTVLTSSAAADSGSEGVTFTNSSCEVIVRDFGPRQGAACSTGGAAGGLLEVASDNDVRRITAPDYFPITVRIESDMADSGCDPQVMGIGATGQIRNVDYSGWIRLLNSGDPDVDMVGFITTVGNTSARFGQLRIDIEKPAGYTGIARHMHDIASQAGQITTGDVITGDPSFTIATYGAGYPSGIKGSFGSSSRACVQVTLSANQNAWAPSSNENVCVTSLGGAGRTINGIAGGWEGRYLRIINLDATNSITFTDGSGSAAAHDQIQTHTGANIVIGPHASLLLWYAQENSGAPGPWRTVD